MSHRVNRPLRVGFVVSYFHPFASGAERQALAQGLELVRRGHIVHVITRAVPGYPVDDEDYHGVLIHRWIKTWDRGPFFALSFVAGVVRALHRLRSQLSLVHTHQGLWEAVATGLFHQGRRDIPTLVQPASSGRYGEADELCRTWGHGQLKKLIFQNTGFAAISADIERQWLGLGVPHGHIVRMASGVDTERFKPGPSSCEDHLLPRPRVIFIGRLHPQKNLPLLFEAWKEVARQVSGNLILIGPGSDRQLLLDLASRLGIASRVQFIGAVADPADYLRAADVFVLPSLAEGMSNSLLEAMATGLPCAVSGIGGNTDLITNGQTGRLITSPTPQTWASVLVELLRDLEQSRHLGHQARQRVVQNFSLGVVVDRYLALYHDMLSGWWPASLG
jgi:glycosyltransferase involved in cell wall biosynthesis